MWDESNDNEMRGEKQGRRERLCVCMLQGFFPFPWDSRRQHFFQARAKMKGKKGKFRAKNAQPGGTADWSNDVIGQ